MAKRFEPTKKQERSYMRWCATRPPIVRANAERFPPWELYLLKSSGHRVFTLGYNEDGTMSVAVTGTYNLVTFERQVFGVTPDDLEPCELPGADDPVGTVMDQKQALDNIDAMRVLIRPDLWVMGPDGKATRKH